MKFNVPAKIRCTYLLELVEHGLGPVGLGHVGEAVQVDALDGRDGRDSVA